MSLILEALRKSEAERRRGESPDLYAELPPMTRVQAQTKPIWWWLVVAAVVVAVLVWWLGIRQTPSVQPIADGAGDIGKRDRFADAVPPRTETPAIAESSTAPVEPAPESRPATPVPVPASPAVVAVPAPPPVDTKPEQDTNKQAVAVAPPVPEPVPAPPIAVPEPLPAPPPAPVAVDRNEGLLQLADLPVAERKQLPPLKLSMHMWNDVPAQRFVIIDGQRLSEGGRIGDAVLVAIRTDGVVLDWNGRRLKLPIR